MSPAKRAGFFEGSKSERWRPDLRCWYGFLHFASVLGAFDDEDVRNFLSDKEVLSVRDHFFVKDETPFLAAVITYNLLRPEPEVSNDQHAGKNRQKEREAWRAVLEEEDWPLFNTLRDWRNGQAKEEGIPPYVIATNRQLADIAHLRPQQFARNYRYFLKLDVAKFFDCVDHEIRFWGEAQTSSNRVKRGGNFNNNARNVRSANRNNNSPDNRNNNLGFRLLSTRHLRGNLRMRTSSSVQERLPCSHID